MVSQKTLRNFRIKDGDYFIRPASSLDPFSQMATLLYDASPEVFDSWFGNDRDYGIKVLTHLCSEPRTLFSYEHCLIIEHPKGDKIFAIANLVDSETKLRYDYHFLQNVSPRADQVINSYVYGWLDRIKAYGESTLFLPNFAHAGNNPNNYIPADVLLQYVTKWAKLHHYQKIVTECRDDDRPTNIFLKSHGFTYSGTNPRQYFSEDRSANISTYINRHLT